MGTKVSSVLKHKGHDVVTVAPERFELDEIGHYAAAMFLQESIGADSVFRGLRPEL